MEKEKVEIYYGVILAQDDKHVKLSVMSKNKKEVEQIYPDAKIVEVHIGRKI